VGAAVLETIVRFAWRRPWRVLAGALVVVVVAGVLASRLQLRSGLADLLRSDDPVAREFTRIVDRLPSTLMMVVSIEGPERDANIRAAQLITQRLDTLRPRLVTRVIGDIRAERAFFEAHKWLYLDLPALEDIVYRLHTTLVRAKNPLFVPLDDDETPQQLVDRMKAKAKNSGADRFPSGFFEGEGGKFVVVLVRPVRGSLGQDVGGELRDATRVILADLKPQLDPRIHVELGGNLIVGLEERAALMRDLARSTLVCIALVALAVFVYFGRLRVIGLFAVPALVGVTLAYGMASIVWGFVNMSAAFMGSIIVGNGINFAIVLQARYDEARRGGAAAQDAALLAVRTTAVPTLVAALAATCAYGSLVMTRFRGFSQFGAIGATGMIAAWCSTFVVLPALWAVADHGSARKRLRWPGVARLRGKAPRWLPAGVLVVGAAITVIAVAAIPAYLHEPFEYDMTKLRTRSSAGASAKNARIEKIFGETVAPPVLLAERRDQVPEIATILRERAATPIGKELISAVRTVDDFVPPDQDKKLALLAEARTMLDSPDLAELDDPKDREALREWRPPDALKAISVADLPVTVRELFSEIDGTVGRIVLIYDHSVKTAYDGHAQLEMDRLIGEVKLHDGSVARSPILFAALLRGIAHDAPIATTIALFAVLVLVILAERGRRGTVLVVGTLVIGITWMIGIAAWGGVKVNFLNFIALPISIGIGVDYGINMYRRYCLEGTGGVGRAMRGVAGALVLCSSTTVIGYGSLLFADNQALRSFGEMAILGELATVLAAVTLLPAALALLERRTGAEREAPR
jgi:predicted RND superfamily exporter protein